MNQINLNKLYYFYVVAQEGSIKEASKKLHLTQPTISTQIKQLEEELGFELFFREHRALKLNRNGNFILKKAEKIFLMTDDLISSLPQRGKKDRIKVRIGAIQSLSNSFIYDFSLKLWSDPYIELSVEQGSVSQLISKMDRNEIDIVLSDGPMLKTKKYQTTPLGTAKIAAVSSPSFRHEKRNFPYNLNEKPYLAFSNQGRLQEDVNYFFEQNDIHPDKIGEVDDVTLMRVIAEHSKCFCVLPLNAVKEDLKQKKLILLGHLPEVQSGLWAITSRTSNKKTLTKKLLKDYFVRKK